MSKLSDPIRRKQVSFNAFYFAENNLNHLQGMKDIFQHINEINLWGSSESISGQGSSAQQTGELKQNIQKLFEELKIEILLDAPCGDFGWLSTLDLAIKQYYGVDIIDNLIKKHTEHYADDSRFKFILADITQDSLPSSDLILCRDALVHFSNADIFQALQNFKKTNSRYLLTTTFTDCTENVDILTGDWRPINLQQAPFNLPTPIAIINEICSEAEGLYSDKSLGLWEIKKIKI